MPRAAVVVGSVVVRSPRVMQMEGIFDVPPSGRAELCWDVDLPLDERPWNIGLIVGPSGSGKTTVARALWPDHLARTFDWPEDRSILDAFPAGMGIKDIVALLSSVGFSSPPSWVRPYRVLSTGEQFRVTMARVLAEASDLAVVDEFTSVVDRTVARIGSAALSRAIRERGQRFIAATCHEDVLDWLQPDWTYRPALHEFAWRSLQRRPAIRLDIRRVHHSAWAVFRRHHYLSADLNKAATCLLASWQDRPVAFSAWLPMPSGTVNGVYREHRTVTLPDYQGVGIGNRVSEFCASLLKANGKRAMSTTSHPAMIRSRAGSTIWKMHRAPSRTPKHDRGAFRFNDNAMKRAAERLSAGFEYVGPAADRETAECLLRGVA